jgi:hypothetical protein
MVKIVFISFDVVIIEWEYVKIIRERVYSETGIPKQNILVCATHNHACPAVVDRPGFKKEGRYIDFIIDKGVLAVIDAEKNMLDVELGVIEGLEARLSFNRRFVKKDGTAISQPQNVSVITDDILKREGPIDPGLGVLCFRDRKKQVIGFIVNFACHACHNMGMVSAGFPGAMYRELKNTYGKNCACLFLNGACGNVIHCDYLDLEHKISPEFMGKTLAEDIKELVDRIEFSADAGVSAREEILTVKYRDISELREQVNRPELFVNVFKGLIEKKWYRASLEKLTEITKKSETEDIVLQVIKVGGCVFAAVPAEYFSEFALRIKEESRKACVFVVTLANGWLGYIPHRKAFNRRGGHETTTAWWSKMAPETGDIIADKLMELINKED